MRSVGFVAVVAAVAGGVAGALLARVLAPPRGQADATTGDTDALARIERRLERVEERLAVGAPRPVELRVPPAERPDARTGPEPASTPEPAATSDAGPATLRAELAALRSQLAAMSAAQEALAKHVGVPPPWPTDPAAVERIRARWRAKLEASGKALWDEYPKGPDPRGDPVAWSRFDDHRRATADFEAATDAAALRALSEGEHRSFFTVER